MVVFALVSSSEQNPSLSHSINYNNSNISKDLNTRHGNGNTSKTSINGLHCTTSQTNRDVLDELMGLNTYPVFNTNDLNTSSFNIEDIMNKLPLTKDNTDYKSALLCSLYSQVEYLKQESIDKTNIIKALTRNTETNTDESKIINYVTKCINCSQELADTDTYIRRVDPVPNIDQETNIADNNITSGSGSTVLNSTTTYEADDIKITHEISGFNETTTYPIEVLNLEEERRNDETFSINGQDSDTTISDTSLDDSQVSYDRFKWEKHSSGFASRMLKKMGYKGRGLGKSENGITEPIPVESKKAFCSKDSNDQPKRKVLFILSSSMLNQMEEKRLSRGNIDVKVQCHGGCTIQCTYSHLPHIFNTKPDYILLHIGSNDCIGRTSDEVLKDYEMLINYIKMVFPCSMIIISLPIIRADNTTANAIQQNLKVKLKKLFFPQLDNSNIGLSHLGKKGLHLNSHGTKLIARNIISLIKRL